MLEVEVKLNGSQVATLRITQPATGHPFDLNEYVAELAIDTGSMIGSHRRAFVSRYELREPIKLIYVALSQFEHHFTVIDEGQETHYDTDGAAQGSPSIAQRGLDRTLPTD